MTSFILLQNVAYEGSSLKGIFTSLEDALDHIDAMDGYCMEEFVCKRDDLESLDDWDLARVQNATAGWNIAGPADLSFHIYACVVPNAA